jgi:hypothetical protein
MLILLGMLRTPCMISDGIAKDEILNSHHLCEIPLVPPCFSCTKAEVTTKKE